ncbi:unnamed protein product [Pleuronectes platessa]|uniref:Uncharacterized protein n=1 Tax=Pleuronectes platessa TaxID=8262 RepID=A0A9N7Z5J0_PLEPL|nr:unnamed protein product [Pleuronectes platessa]
MGPTACSTTTRAATYKAAHCTATQTSHATSFEATRCDSERSSREDSFERYPTCEALNNTAAFRKQVSMRMQRRKPFHYRDGQTSCREQWTGKEQHREGGVQPPGVKVEFAAAVNAASLPPLLQMKTGSSDSWDQIMLESSYRDP